MRNKRKFKIYFKCAYCRGKNYFKKGYKHVNAFTNTGFYVCAECEKESEVK